MGQEWRTLVKRVESERAITASTRCWQKGECPPEHMTRRPHASLKDAADNVPVRRRNPCAIRKDLDPHVHTLTARVLVDARGVRILIALSKAAAAMDSCLPRKRAWAERDLLLHGMACMKLLKNAREHADRCAKPLPFDLLAMLEEWTLTNDEAEKLRALLARRHNVSGVSGVVGDQNDSPLLRLPQEIVAQDIAGRIGAGPLTCALTCKSLRNAVLWSCQRSDVGTRLCTPASGAFASPVLLRWAIEAGGLSSTNLAVLAARQGNLGALQLLHSMDIPIQVDAGFEAYWTLSELAAPDLRPAVLLLHSPTRRLCDDTIATIEWLQAKKLLVDRVKGSDSHAIAHQMNNGPYCRRHIINLLDAWRRLLRGAEDAHPETLWPNEDAFEEEAFPNQHAFAPVLLTEGTCTARVFDKWLDATRFTLGDGNESTLLDVTRMAAARRLVREHTAQPPN